MGRKESGDALPVTSARILQLHSEMKDRGLVHDQSEDRKRKRRKERRRTTEIKHEELKKSTDTLSRRHREDRRRDKVDKSKAVSKSSNSVSFAKEVSTKEISVPSPGSDDSSRVKPLKSSLKNSEKIQLKNSVLKNLEHGETSSSGVQSGSNNSDADSINHKTEKQKRPRSTTRSTLEKSKKSEKMGKTSSDSDENENFGDMLRIKAQQRKQRAAEAKVEESERKLIEFAQRLSARKQKLEDLHQRLKQRKEKLKEREDKLKFFEAQISEREAKLKAKSKVVRHREAHLRHEEGSVELREKTVTNKLVELEARTKLIEVKEDLSVEINDLARRQLYQSSWNVYAKGNGSSVTSKSTESLDNLSDIDSDNLVKSIADCTLNRSALRPKQKQVGLLL